jgi:hypothetical protein
VTRRARKPAGSSGSSSSKRTLLTVEEGRQILGAEAEQLTDREVAMLFEQAGELAEILLDQCESTRYSARIGGEEPPDEER